MCSTNVPISLSPAPLCVAQLNRKAMWLTQLPATFADQFCQCTCVIAVGGGKPKMRWYFSRQGWPTSSVLGGRAPGSEEEQTQLIDTLQDWKTDKYQQMIG